MKKFVVLSYLVILAAFLNAQTVEISYNFIGDVTLRHWYSDTCIVREMVNIPPILMLDKVDFRNKQVISQIKEYNDISYNSTNAVTSFKALKKKKLYDHVRVTFSDKTRTVLGIECRYASVTDKTTIYDVWYAPLADFEKLDYNFHSRYKDVPGVVLEEYMNGHLIMQAVKIERGKWCQCNWTDYWGL